MNQGLLIILYNYICISSPTHSGMDHYHNLENGTVDDIEVRICVPQNGGVLGNCTYGSHTRSCTFNLQLAIVYICI